MPFFHTPEIAFHIPIYWRKDFNLTKSKKYYFGVLKSLIIAPILQIPL